MIDTKRCLCGTMLALLLSPASARTEKESQVAKLHNQGKTAYAKQDYDGVITACDEALRLDAKDFHSHIGRGHAYRMKHDFKRAIADYGEAIRLLREDPRTYDDRGFVGTLSDYSHALYFRRLLADAYVNRADTYVEKHDYERAIKDLGKAISLEPRDGKLYLHRAFVHIARKDFGRAIADYSCLVRLMPDQAESYIQRGTLYMQMMDYEHALADLDEAVRLNPKHPQAYFYRGAVCSSLMEYARAITDYQEAVRLDPQYCQADFALAYLFANCPKAVLRDRQKALDYARKGCGVTERNESEEYEIPTRGFAIPIRFNPNRREQIQKLRLFVSEDQGKTWSHLKEYMPSDKQIIFTACHDGPYWFALQEVLLPWHVSFAQIDATNRLVS
ncbi:MAG: tetratricopeptide repeat protein [Gemmataceae bacterium]